ncbi:MAG: hypothetical protein ACHREM_00270 [Polyangiales bacterium]
MTTMPAYNFPPDSVDAFFPPTPDPTSFVHAAASTSNEAVCGMSLGLGLPPPKRIVHLFTDHPAFDSHWSSQGNRCPECIKALDIIETARLEREARRASEAALVVAKRALEDPVWISLFAVADAWDVGERGHRDELSPSLLDGYVDDATKRLARATVIPSEDRALLASLEPIAARLTTKIVERERRRIADALAKDYDGLAAEFGEHGAAVLEHVQTGFARATVSSLGALSDEMRKTGRSDAD